MMVEVETEEVIVIAWVVVVQEPRIRLRARLGIPFLSPFVHTKRFVSPFLLLTELSSSTHRKRNREVNAL